MVFIRGLIAFSFLVAGTAFADPDFKEPADTLKSSSSAVSRSGQSVHQMMAAQPERLAQSVQSADVPPNQLQLAFGPSLPDSLKPATRVDVDRPSRNVGGEMIRIRFNHAMKLSQLTLRSFSNAGGGKNLIREVFALSDTPAGGGKPTRTQLPAFYDPSITNGVEGIYSKDQQTNRIMLPAGGYITSTLAAAGDVRELQINVEGYSSDDATLFVQVIAETPIATDRLTLTRGWADPDDDTDWSPVRPYEGYYQTQGFCDMYMRVDGNYVTITYPQGCEDAGLTTLMRCDWSNGVCRVAQRDQNVCAGYTIRWRGVKTHTWNNPCIGYSGTSVWIGR